LKKEVEVWKNKYAEAENEIKQTEQKFENFKDAHTNHGTTDLL